MYCCIVIKVQNNELLYSIHVGKGMPIRNTNFLNVDAGTFLKISLRKDDNCLEPKKKVEKQMMGTKKLRNEIII